MATERGIHDQEMCQLSKTRSKLISRSTFATYESVARGLTLPVVCPDGRASDWLLPLARGDPQVQPDWQHREQSVAAGSGTHSQQAAHGRREAAQGRPGARRHREDLRQGERLIMLLLDWLFWEQ